MSGPSRSALCACRPPRQPLCLLGPSTSSQGPPHGNRPPPRPAKPLGGRSRPLWRGGTRRPPPQASKAVLEDEGSCFFGLAEESGVDLRRVALGKGKHGGRGVFAAIDLSRGSPVMEVPHRLMLRASTIQAAPPSAISHTRGHESLAALLLACRLTGEGRGDRCLLEGWLLSERAVKLPACLPEVLPPPTGTTADAKCTTDRPQHGQRL